MSRITVYQDGVLIADSNAGLGIPIVEPPHPTPPPYTAPPSGSVDGPFPAKPGSTVKFTSQLGLIHSWPLPKTSGIISNVEYPGQRFGIEWSISPTPGDFSYYKTDGACIIGRGGVKQIVCGGKGDSESGGIKWNMSNGCVVPPGAPWYVNFRITNGVEAGVDASCMIGLAL